MSEQERQRWDKRDSDVYVADGYALHPPRLQAGPCCGHQLQPRQWRYDGRTRDWRARCLCGALLIVLAALSERKDPMPHFCGCGHDTALCQMCRRGGCDTPDCPTYLAMRWDTRLAPAGTICAAHTEGQVLAFLTQRPR